MYIYIYISIYYAMFFERKVNRTLNCSHAKACQEERGPRRHCRAPPMQAQFAATLRLLSGGRYCKVSRCRDRHLPNRRIGQVVIHRCTDTGCIVVIAWDATVLMRCNCLSVSRCFSSTPISLFICRQTYFSFWHIAVYCWYLPYPFSLAPSLSLPHASVQVATDDLCGLRVTRRRAWPASQPASH